MYQIHLVHIRGRSQRDSRPIHTIFSPEMYTSSHRDANGSPFHVIGDSTPYVPLTDTQPTATWCFNNTLIDETCTASACCLDYIREVGECCTYIFFPISTDAK